MKFLFRRHWGEYIIYNFDYEYIRKYTTIGKTSFTIEISCPGGELLKLKNCETIPLNCRTVAAYCASVLRRAGFWAQYVQRTFCLMFSCCCFYLAAPRSLTGTVQLHEIFCLWFLFINRTQLILIRPKVRWKHTVSFHWFGEYTKIHFACWETALHSFRMHSERPAKIYLILLVWCKYSAKRSTVSFWVFIKPSFIPRIQHLKWC